MKNRNRSSEIPGIELSNDEKRMFRGGEDPIEPRIWCNCDLEGYGSVMTGWCGLQTVDECEAALRDMYPRPPYDCACEEREPDQ